MNSRFNEEVGTRIKTYRENLNISRESLAEKLFISCNFLYSIENGTKGFSADILYDLSEALGVSCENILFGTIDDTEKMKLISTINKFDDDCRRDVIELIKSIRNITII